MASLKHKVLSLGKFVESNLMLALKALLSRDLDLAKIAYSNTTSVLELYAEVAKPESRPTENIKSDVQEDIQALQICHNLEYISQLTVPIAKGTVRLLKTNEGVNEAQSTISLWEQCILLLHKALDCYSNNTKFPYSRSEEQKRMQSVRDTAILGLKDAGSHYLVKNKALVELEMICTYLDRIFMRTLEMSDQHLSDPGVIQQLEHS